MESASLAVCDECRDSIVCSFGSTDESVDSRDGATTATTTAAVALPEAMAKDDCNHQGTCRSRWLSALEMPMIRSPIQVVVRVQD
jgi:hypothetical protein